MLGDIAGGVGFDEQVEVALVVVGGDGGVGADDLFGLAVDGEGGTEGDVLADWEAEDVGGFGEGKAVAVGGMWLVGFQWIVFGARTYIATLCVRIVFSFSSKSWKFAGSSTFRSPVHGLLLAIPTGHARPV